MILKLFEGRAPSLHPGCYAAENATLVGDVTLGEGTSVWYGAVLRGDDAPIHVGEGTNVQDNAVFHGAEGFPLTVGDHVTVGHGAIVHGCTVDDCCLIGMGAILLDGCVIGAGSIVGAGALVTQNKVIPPGSLVMGSPAKVVRPLRRDELEHLAESAAQYRRNAAKQLPAASGLSGIPQR